MLKISHNPQHNQFLAQMMKVLTVNHLHPSFKSRFNCENIKEGINNQTCPPIKNHFSITNIFILNYYFEPKSLLQNEKNQNKNSVKY